MPINDRFKRAMAKAGRRSGGGAVAVRRTYARRTIPRSLPQSTVQAVVARAMAKNSEQKYCDMFLVNASTNVPAGLGTNSFIFVLNGIQQGAGQYNRIGNKVNLQSLKCELNFTHTYSQDPGLANAIRGNMVRIVCFWDKEGAGNPTPAFNQIFGEIYQDGSSGSTILSGVVPYLKHRFIILHDEVIQMKADCNNFVVPGPTDPATVPVAVSNHYQSRFFINLAKKQLQTIYSGTANPVTIANFSSGVLYLAIRALDLGIPNTNTVDLLANYGPRVRYTDA